VFLEAEQMAHITLTAGDIMVTKLTVLRPETRVDEAIGLLLAHRISGAPVVDADYNLVGILSEKDCIHAQMQAIHDRMPPLPVSEVMSTDLKTINESTDLLTIAHFFISNSVRRLPVVEGDRLVGQISRRDLMRAIHRVVNEAEHHDSAFLYLSAVGSRDKIPR
jgi:CBS domain-containing protein